MRLPSRIGTITLRSMIASDSSSFSVALRAATTGGSSAGRGWAQALAAIAKTIVGSTEDRFIFIAVQISVLLFGKLIAGVNGLAFAPQTHGRTVPGTGSRRGVQERIFRRRDVRHVWCVD